MALSGKTQKRRGNMRIKYVVRLSADERAQLEQILSKGKIGAQRRKHAQVLLKVDEGELGPAWTNERAAEAAEVSVNTFAGWSERSTTDCDGLRKTSCGTGALDVATVGRQARRTEGGRECLAGDGASETKKNELQPHRSEYWCIPPKANAEFVCAMENVLETYQLPYNPEEPVVCFDERPVQLIADITPPLLAQPATAEHSGTLARVDYEYERCGTANVFLFTEPLASWRHVAVTAHRTRTDLALQLRWLVDEKHPQARKIKIVCDNLNTHDGASLYEAFPPAEARRILSKLEFIYTPKHGSWLDIAECELSIFSRQCLAKRIDSIELLTAEAAAWECDRNKTQTGVDWQFRAADARIKLKRLYPKVQN